MIQRGRFELKFIIDYELRARLLASIQEALEPDPHGSRYRVTTRYYDTPDLEAYREKLDGIKERRKFRLRRYGEDGPYGFEIKHRVGDNVFKDRLSLVPDRARKLMTAPDLEALDESLASSPAAPSSALLQIQSAITSKRLQPVNYIAYLREAYVGRLDPFLRVTFDHELTSAFGQGGPPRPIGTPGQVVLELKFNRVLPTWLRQSLVGTRLRPRRFSKYAAGVEVLPELTDRVLRAMV